MDENKGLLTVTIAVVVVTVLALFGLLFFLTPKPMSDDEKDQYMTREDSHIKGKSEAKVEMVVFEDFECPACAVVQVEIQKLLAAYPNDVKLIHRHFPLSYHLNAISASLAAEAAGKEGKFYEYSEILYTKRLEWVELEGDSLISKYKDFAKELKLKDIDAFEKSIRDQEFLNKINRDQEDGEKLKVDATPTVYINNKKMDYPSYDEMEKEVKKILTQN